MKILNPEMNKQFYFPKVKNTPKSVKEKIFSSSYHSYIWPTDNWVEVHLFKNKKIATKIVFTNHNNEIILNNRPKTCSEGYKASVAVFEGRIKSFIIPRENVFGDKNIIYCEPKDADEKRWLEWHPDDDFKTEIELEVLTHYFLETHNGMIFGREIFSDGSVGDLVNLGDQ